MNHQPLERKSDRIADIMERVREEQRRELAGLTGTLNDINSAFSAYRTKSEKILADRENETAELRDRIEELEARANQPGRVGLRDSFKAKHLLEFTNWLRRPTDPDRKNALWETERQGIERKDISVGSSADGGFAVPEEIQQNIERLELNFSPVRQLVNVVQAGTSDFKALVNIRGATGGWVSESGSRTKTDTSQFRQVAPTMGELYAYPQVSEWSMDDIFFDVQGWVEAEAAEAFAVAEGAAVISGDGSNKPTGMTNTAPVSTADEASPLRAAEAYQFVPCLSSQSPAVAEILPDSLITLLYTVRSQYRQNGVWVMNSNTIGAVRKLKDANGRYLWVDSLAAGQPNMLLGYPVVPWEQMDDVGTNKLPVAFGDFSRGYLLVDRVGLRITLDQVTSPGFVKFYIRRREGGKPWNNDAIKFLKTTIA